MESSSSLNSVIMESRILRSGSVFKGLNKVQNFEVEVVVDVTDYEISFVS
jgi:hypothetical protein